MGFPNTVQIPIQFSGGLNSKMADFTLDQPYLDLAENAVYNLTGQVDKRTGFTAISTNIQGGGNISAGATLTTFNGELLLLDGKNLYSWQEQEKVWISRGSAFSTINDQTRVLNTKIATQKNPDVSSIGDISLYVWEDDRQFPLQQNGVRYTVLNNKTGTIIVSDQFLYFAGTRPKVVNDGINFYVIYNADASTILYATIPVAASNTIPTNYTFITEAGLSQSAQAAIPYDAVIFQGKLLVVYAGQEGLSFSNINLAFNSDVEINTIGICTDSEGKLWVSYSNNTDTFVLAYTYNGFAWDKIVGPVVLNAITSNKSVNIALIEDINKGSVNLTNEIALAGNNNFCNNYTISSRNGGVSSFIGQMRSVGLASKPFFYNDNIFINTVWQSNLQATYFTQCLTQGAQFRSGTANIQAQDNEALAVSFAVVSKHSPNNGGTYRTNSLLSQADHISGDSFIFAGQRKGPFTSFQNAAVVNYGVAGYSIIFNSDNNFNNVSANNNLHLVGGIKKIYDGISFVEDNFNLFPEDSSGFGCEIHNITIVPPSGLLDGYNLLNDNSYVFDGFTYHSAGNLTYDPLTQPNQYQWIVCYEWTDNAGQVQRSGPSVPFTAVTFSTGQGAILTGPMLRITEKVASRSTVVVSIYRTIKNGSVFYKITNDDNPLVNDSTVDTWIFVDTLSDFQIMSDENLYTGSQLGNTSPPPCSLISLYQQRLMINSTEDPGVIWFSQNKFEQDQYNTLSLDWNTSFIEGIDSRFGNEITAIGLLDNSLAIFKDTSIFLLQGDGPNAFNTSGQFNDASLLVSDTGCSNQNSLCFITQTPNLPGGLLFKSKKGIYLLGRDESINYIGAPVEKYNNLTITSANLLAQTNQVVFTTLEGTILVYNYFFNAWTTWTGLDAVSACVWNDQLCILRSNGSVMIQDITNTIFIDTYDDNTSYPVHMKLRTPFIKMNGMQGYQSVFNCTILGTLQDKHTLSVNVAYDYNPSIEGEVLIDSSLATNRWGGNPIWGSNGSWGQNGQFANYQFQVNINKPRCESIQLTIEDVQPQASKAFSLNGLVLEVLMLPGGMRTPSKNKVGLR